MDNLLIKLLKNRNIPKSVRYLILAALGGFVACVGIMMSINSSMTAGKIFGIVLTIVIIVLGRYAALTIHNN